METGFNYIGFAHLLEKKEFQKDGKKQIYYEKIDTLFGFWYEFTEGRRFIVLSGKYVGKTILPDSGYKICGFKTFNELSNENNHLYEFQKFQSKYQENSIGTYYTYDPSKKFYDIIKDQEVLEQIKSSNKEYDDSILKSGTDISQMYSTIKKTIVAQDEQIMQILTSLFKNQRVINSTLSDDMINKLKENIIVYGLTGTGKTEILNRIAHIYKVPIVIEDATSLSETGYVGRNITDMLENLYLAAGKDIELAQKGILVIDEFDKLAETSNSNDHVSRIGVQRSLLKLLDGSTFYFKNIKFDTSKLTIVALGAFTNMVKDDDYSSITTTHFMDYGIIREVIGRFSGFVAMNPLSKEDIKRILVESDFSPLNTYQLLFDSMNIAFSYDDDFVDYIAERAVSLNTGARSLKTIFDEVISGAMFRIFAGEYSAISLTKPTLDKKSYVLKK